MFKEMIICIIIFVSIFSLDIFTEGYTKETISEMSEMFAELKKEILAKNIEQIDKDIKKIDENWENMHSKLAYYIEHDELEKVETAIVAMKSYIKTDDYSSAVAELEEGKFILEHIQEKNSFNLQNIF